MFQHKASLHPVLNIAGIAILVAGFFFFGWLVLLVSLPSYWVPDTLDVTTLKVLGLVLLLY